MLQQPVDKLSICRGAKYFKHLHSTRVSLEQMEMTPSFLSPENVINGHNILYVLLECALKVADDENSDAMSVVTQKAKTPQTSLVEVVMRRKDSYPSMKTSSSPTADILQYNGFISNQTADTLLYNGLISYLQKHKFGVTAQNLCEYEKCISLLSTFIKRFFVSRKFQMFARF